MTDTRIVECEMCLGTGYLEYSHGRYDPRDGSLITYEQECPACLGRGEVETEAELADEDDAAAEGMSALSDREIDEWLITIERLFGKEWLEGGPDA